jgi:hypothetical protein
MEQRSEEETCFLNVDLDVEAPYDLASFVEALGEKVFDLHTGPLEAGFQTHLELSGEAIRHEDAEAAISGFVKLLTQLAPDTKRLWDGATKRDFNIGIQGGTKPHAFVFALLPQTLAAVAHLGARVVMTVYAVDLESPERQQRAEPGVEPDGRSLAG